MTIFLGYQASSPVFKFKNSSPGTLGNIKGKITAELKLSMILEDNSQMNILKNHTAPPDHLQLKIGTEKQFFDHSTSNIDLYAKILLT